MAPTDDAPTGAFRWLGWSAVLLLLTVVTGIGLISAGVFDPKPIGELTSNQPLYPQIVAADSQTLSWIDEELPPRNYSLRLTAARDSGELDIGYGLAIGELDNYLVVAVSPLGYVTIWRGGMENGEPSASSRLPSPEVAILPWQTWPHVKTNEDSNEIWVDVVDGKLISARVNREILWEGEEPLPGSKVAMWVESFSDPATVEFDELQLFSE
jgi:hypothetical protein